MLQAAVNVVLAQEMTYVKGCGPYRRASGRVSNDSRGSAGASRVVD